ncbi:MAG: hypothetical protein IKT09_05045 [Synergistes sp.]|nr:hypothetical protein [Synergistes sp.]
MKKIDRLMQAIRLDKEMLDEEQAEYLEGFIRWQIMHNSDRCPGYFSKIIRPCAKEMSVLATCVSAGAECRDCWEQEAKQ